VRPGEIHHHRNFYLDRDTGEYRGKYFLVLAALPGGDIVVRVLTSRPHGRPTQPPCFHGDPYPGFYFGTIGRHLKRDSWLDLRAMADVDPGAASKERLRGDLTLVMVLDMDLFRQALSCAASANDTTRMQERAMRDQMATMD
jgi:hypothetical protein